jgi:fructose-specific phosphotransferase system IIC component
MKELDIAGVYITPILGWAIVALLVWTVLRRLIDKAGLARWIWHRGLFDAALFIIVLGGVVAAAGRLTEL